MELFHFFKHKAPKAGIRRTTVIPQQSFFPLFNLYMVLLSWKNYWLLHFKFLYLRLYNNIGCLSCACNDLVAAF